MGRCRLRPGRPPALRQEPAARRLAYVLILAAWVRPVLSKARGLHVDDLSEEEASELEAIMGGGGARLKMRPRSLEETARGQPPPS